MRPQEEDCSPGGEGTSAQTLLSRVHSDFRARSGRRTKGHRKNGVKGHIFGDGMSGSVAEYLWETVDSPERSTVFGQKGASLCVFSEDPFCVL